MSGFIGNLTKKNPGAVAHLILEGGLTKNTNKED